MTTPHHEDRQAGGEEAERAQPARRRPPRRGPAHLAILLMPIAVILLGLTVSSSLGPFWIWPRPDPDYCYLLNGLNITQGYRPWHVDHPGTPVQLVVAGVIVAAYAAAGSELPMAQDVIANPEFYLRMSHLALLLLTALCAVAFGIAVLRISGSVLCAVGSQVMCLAGLPTVIALARVNPEPMLLSVAMLLGAAALVVAADPAGMRKRSLRWGLLLGALVGLGIACKMTFAPLILIALAAMRGVRQWVAVGLAVVAAFGLATIPIWYRWEYVWNWFIKNAGNPGRYGGNQRPQAGFASSLLTTLQFELVLPIVMGIMLLVIAGVTVIARQRAVSGRTRQLQALLIGLLGAKLVIVLVMAKYPEPRYLIPALALIGPAVAALWIMASELPRRLARVAILLIIAGIATSALTTSWRLTAWAARASNYRDRVMAVEAAVDDHRDGHIIAYTFGTSSEVNALLFASPWSHSRHSALIAERFPDAIYWAGRNRPHFRAGTRIPDEKIEELIASGRLLYRARVHQMPAELEIDVIVDRGEALLRPRLPAEPEADRGP